MMRTRSGGHDNEGLSYVTQGPFVVLDMFNLRSIDNIDVVDKTLWVQSGASLGEIYYNIANKTDNSYAFPAGVCPTVGAGGHFSGGGYGNMMRKYGLSVDNIIDARIVDVYGNIHDRKSMGEDLFWAIRGGGGASYGVVISWKLKLVPIPETVTVFRVNRTIEENAINLVEKWQNVASKLDKDLFIRLELGAEMANGFNKTVRANFIALFLGKTERLIDIMNECFPDLGLKEEDCIEMSWLESVLYWYNLPTNTPPEILLTREPTNGGFGKLRSDFVKKVIQKEGLKCMFDKMIELQGGILMKWNPYGGRMSEIKPWETPRPHRAGYLYKIQYWIPWSEEENPNPSRPLNLLEQLYVEMGKYVTKKPREAYLNYRDLDIGYSPRCDGVYGAGKNPGIKYFKGNYPRLVKVKTEVDPENFFRDEQSIPPSHKINY